MLYVAVRSNNNQSSKATDRIAAAGVLSPLAEANALVDRADAELPGH